MPTSTVEIVFGFKDGTTKKITFGPFSSDSSALDMLKSRIMAFNNGYTSSKWQYTIDGSIGASAPLAPFVIQTYPLIVNANGSELLDTAPITEAYITTTQRTDINLNV